MTKREMAIIRRELVDICHKIEAASVAVEIQATGLAKSILDESTERLNTAIVAIITSEAT